MIYLTASGALFFALLPDLPYGFFQLLRFFICGVSCYAAFMLMEDKRKAWAWLFIFIAVLFNPFIKIHFDREVWQVIDVLVALIFLFTGAITWLKQKKLARIVRAETKQTNVKITEEHSDHYVDIVAEVYKQSAMPDFYCFWCERITIFDNIAGMTSCRSCGYTKRLAIEKAANRLRERKKKEKTPMDSEGLEW